MTEAETGEEDEDVIPEEDAEENADEDEELSEGIFFMSFKRWRLSFKKEQLSSYFSDFKGRNAGETKRRRVKSLRQAWNPVPGKSASITSVVSKKVLLKLYSWSSWSRNKINYNQVNRWQDCNWLLGWLKPTSWMTEFLLNWMNKLDYRWRWRRWGFFRNRDKNMNPFLRSILWICFFEPLFESLFESGWRRTNGGGICLCSLFWKQDKGTAGGEWWWWRQWSSSVIQQEQEHPLILWFSAKIFCAKSMLMRNTHRISRRIKEIFVVYQEDEEGRG